MSHALSNPDQINPMKYKSTSFGLLAAIGILLLVITLGSCKRDRFELDRLASTEWEPSLAFPLMKANLGVYDVMARIDSSDLFIIDPLTGQVALIYEGELFSFSAQEVLQLPNQAFGTTFTLDLPEQASLTGVGQVTKLLSFDETLVMPSGVQTDSVTYLGGSLDITINSDFQHSGTVQIVAPSLRKNGQPFEQFIDVNYVSGPVSVTESYDMTGYTMDLTDGGTTFNTLPLDLSLTLINSGNGITGTEAVDVAFDYTDLEFEAIYGNFGQQTISLDNDSILIRIFTNSVDGTFQLTDPKLRLYIDNSFGFPVELSIDTLDSRNAVTGETTPLLPGLDPFLINSPTLQQIGQSVPTDTVIDNTNSNIIALMEPTPKWLVHAISAVSNPPSAPSAYNFLRHDSKFIVDTELEMPLVGWADNWSITDTVAFTFEEDNVKEIQSVELRVYVANHFPMNARMQIYLLDENYMVIDSIVPTEHDLIQTGVIDGIGRVVEETVTITDIPFDQSRMPNLYNARYARVWADAESTTAADETVVRIYDSYYMNFRVGMKVNARINL